MCKFTVSPCLTCNGELSGYRKDFVMMTETENDVCYDFLLAVLVQNTPNKLLNLLTHAPGMSKRDHMSVENDMHVLC